MKPSLSPVLSLSCLGLAAAILAGCGPAEPTGPRAFSGLGKPRVVATNYPLYWMAGRIGGEAVELSFPAPEDGDPAFWEPTEADLAAFQSADLILRNGATYEKWADRVSLPESTQVDTARAFAGQFIVIEEASTHSHGASGEHSHAGVAFTTWLDLKQALQQAEAIRSALATLLPGQAAAFEANFTALKADLEALDGELAAAAGRLGQTPLVASHPVYQYLARRYGLNLQSVLWEPETVPDDAAMADLAKILARHPARVMLWEGEPAAESVKKLEAIGVQSVVFDPCGNRPGDGADFLSVMKANVAALGRIAAPAP